MGDKKVYNCERVNYTILMNKDGKLSWRPLQFIHPVLYSDLVRKITDEDSWAKLQGRFSIFHSNLQIECLSLPAVGDDEQADRAAQVSNWWQAVELRSVELSLEYDYLFDTDIADCYGSIYTHSLSWAIETKEVAKINRDRQLLGNYIDGAIQKMQYNQTNGIPQGSVLMDFIAEVLLGYIDSLLTEKLVENGIEDYKILRYRDDYRIFVNNPTDGENILKLLSEVLSDSGLRLGASKTKASSDVIYSSIKKDKYDWLSSRNTHGNLFKHALIIKKHADLHPGSGSLATALKKFHLRVLRLNSCDTTLTAVISIVMDIAYKNPRVYPVCFAILSKYLSLVPENEERLTFINKIKKKFDKLPNIGYMEIWFQRAIKQNLTDINFQENLCRIVRGEQLSIWNSEWLAAASLNQLLNTTPIINYELLTSTEEIIDSTEYDLFPGKSG